MLALRTLSAMVRQLKCSSWSDGMAVRLHRRKGCSRQEGRSIPQRTCGGDEQRLQQMCWPGHAAHWGLCWSLHAWGCWTEGARPAHKTTCLTGACVCDKSTAAFSWVLGIAELMAVVDTQAADRALVAACQAGCSASGWQGSCALGFIFVLVLCGKAALGCCRGQPEGMLPTCADKPLPAEARRWLLSVCM